MNLHYNQKTLHSPWHLCKPVLFLFQQEDQDAAEEDRRLKELAAVGPIIALDPAIAVDDAGDVTQTVGNITTGTDQMSVNIAGEGVQGVQDASFQLTQHERINRRIRFLEDFIHANG